MRIVQDVTPSSTASKTQGNLSDQGITYNEPGVTYNEPGVTYGGLYGFSDVIPNISLSSIPLPINMITFPSPPIISLTSSPIPSIVGYADIYQGSVPVGQNQSLGPGWFMFITH